MSNKKSTGSSEQKNTWQAKRSAETRIAIMEAAIECLIEYGYAKTSTALIVKQAGLSRGALMHHFQSRDDVIFETASYLYEKRLTEYRSMMKDIDTSPEEDFRKKEALAIRSLWKYYQLPSFIAYHELKTAARTDPKLSEMLTPIEKSSGDHLQSDIENLFPSWAKMGEARVLATDLLFFTMESMATTRIKRNKKKRIDNMLKLLTTDLDYLFTKSQND